MVVRSGCRRAPARGPTAQRIPGELARTGGRRAGKGPPVGASRGVPAWKGAPPAIAPPRQPNPARTGFKLQRCPQWSQWKCKKGSRCPLAHGDHELAPKEVRAPATAGGLLGRLPPLPPRARTATGGVSAPSGSRCGAELAARLYYIFCLAAAHLALRLELPQVRKRIRDEQEAIKKRAEGGDSGGGLRVGQSAKPHPPSHATKTRVQRRVCKDACARTCVQ